MTIASSSRRQRGLQMCHSKFILPWKHVCMWAESVEKWRYFNTRAMRIYVHIYTLSLTRTFLPFWAPFFVLVLSLNHNTASSGGTFIAHTQIVITNTGNNSCKIVCSVEAEFPNGPPMVGRQIKSGMRAGTADAFVIFGETICKYAEHFPWAIHLATYFCSIITEIHCRISTSE